MIADTVLTQMQALLRMYSASPIAVRTVRSGPQHKGTTRFEHAVAETITLVLRTPLDVSTGPSTRTLSYNRSLLFGKSPLLPLEWHRCRADNRYYSRYTNMADDLHKILEATALNHVKAHESPDPFDPEAIWKYRSPDCTMFFHPENSMPAPFGAGACITKAEHLPALRMLGAITDRLRFEILETSVDVQKRLVTVRMQGIFDFKAVGADLEVRDWMIEYVWMTRHDDISNKIVRVEEYLDVVQVVPMLDKAKRYAEQHTTQC